MKRHHSANVPTDSSWHDRSLGLASVSVPKLRFTFHSDNLVEIREIGLHRRGGLPQYWYVWWLYQLVHIGQLWARSGCCQSARRSGYEPPLLSSHVSYMPVELRNPLGIKIALHARE
jgi:hypothetical protein